MATKAKIAPASTDEQFKFLISCIRYSNNGKVDFTEVATECNIVSKGAAAKRYERMMKQHGLYQGAKSGDTITTSSPASKDGKSPTSGTKDNKAPNAATAAAAKKPKSTKAAPKTPATNKKRKFASLEAATDNNDIQDDNEGFGEPLIKAEHVTPTIKPDPGAAVFAAHRATGIPLSAYQGWHDKYTTEKHPATNVNADHNDTDDGAMFQDFLHPAAFEGHSSGAHGGEYAGFGHGAYDGAGMASADADSDAGAAGMQESILID